MLWFSVARIKLRIHGTYSRIDHHMRTIKIWTWSSQCMCSTTEGTASQLVLSVLQTNGIWLIMGICNQSFWRKMVQGSWQGKGHFVTVCSLAVGADTVTKDWLSCPEIRSRVCHPRMASAVTGGAMLKCLPHWLGAGISHSWTAASMYISVAFCDVTSIRFTPKAIDMSFFFRQW